MKIHNINHILIIFLTIPYFTGTSAKICSLLFCFANLKAQNCIGVIEMHLVNEKWINYKLGQKSIKYIV